MNASQEFDVRGTGALWANHSHIVPKSWLLMVMFAAKFTKPHRCRFHEGIAGPAMGNHGEDLCFKICRVDIHA